VEQGVKDSSTLYLETAPPRVADPRPRLSRAELEMIRNSLVGTIRRIKGDLERAKVEGASEEVLNWYEEWIRKYKRLHRRFARLCEKAG